MKLLVSALLLALASAAKDNNYYANGISSPYQDEKMYWGAGKDVLEDLSQFDALYVTYHNCAWETSTGDEEEGGGGGGDGDDWYVGSVPSFRANAAFSLYGILKGEKDNGCNKKTFINSFHTTRGIESFTNAMAAAGLTDLFQLYDGDGDDDGNLFVTSTCHQDEDEDEDDDGIYNGYKMQSGTSYGLGCAVDGTKSFAIHVYHGGNCDANAINVTLDTLDEFNGKLAQSKCVPIYKTGDYYNAEEEGDEEDNSSPLALLQTSRTCHIHDGTKSCPDPYNRLKVYERNLLKATGSEYFEPWFNKYRVMVISMTMIVVGGILFLAAIVAWALDLFHRESSSMGDGDLAGSPRKKKSKHPKSPKSSKKKASKLSKASQLDRTESLLEKIGRTLGLGDEEKKSKKKSKKKSADSDSPKEERRSNSKSSKSTQRTSKANHSTQLEEDIALQHTASYKSELSAPSDLHRDNPSTGYQGHADADEQSVEMSLAKDPPTSYSYEEMSLPNDPPRSYRSYDHDHIKTEEEESFNGPLAEPGELTRNQSIASGDLTRTQSVASGEFSLTQSVASQSFQAVNDMVHFFKNKAEEVFKDEDEYDDDLPHSAPKKGHDETEVTGEEETTTKKKYRKRQWFKKILGGNTKTKHNDHV